jgi:HAD superfamily hydrolase (TIGR01509 family)
MNGPLPQAVAFDCDGTIADTESLSVEAWRRTLIDQGVEVTTSDLAVLVGWPFAANWARFEDRLGLGTQERFRAGLRSHFAALLDEGLEIHTDVVDVMHELVAQEIPLAVVSSSNRAHVERVLARAGVSHLVRHVVASEDTVQHKPDPTPYQEACRRLGVAPGLAAAVEDTATGASAARTAGLRTIGVLRAHSTPALEEVCHVVVSALRLDVLRLVGAGESEH